MVRLPDIKIDVSNHEGALLYSEKAIASNVIANRRKAQQQKKGSVARTGLNALANIQSQLVTKRYMNKRTKQASKKKKAKSRGK